MKISTRSIYGLRALTFLMKNKSQDSVSLNEISKGENISLSYLEQIFSRLKKAGIVKAEKGLYGGYRIAKNLEETNVYDIFEILETNMSVFKCVSRDGHVDCSESICGAKKILSTLQLAINKTLTDIKLQDLV